MYCKGPVSRHGLLTRATSEYMRHGVELAEFPNSGFGQRNRLTGDSAHDQISLRLLRQANGDQGAAVDDVVLVEVRACVKDSKIQVTTDTALIGDNRALDSMGLVELCLRLEDRATELGFEFDWTSEAAMSRSRGMFRSVGALQEEFTRQQIEQT